MWIDQHLTPDMHYVYNPLTLFNDQWRWDQNKLENLPDDRLTVVNCASENWGEGDFIVDLHNQLTARNKKFVILSHRPGQHLTKPNLVFYPYWYVWSKIHLFNHQVNFNSDIRKYAVSSVGKTPRPHRIFNYLTFEKTQDMLFVMHQGDVQLSDDDIVLSKEMIGLWQELQHTLPPAANKDFNGIQDDAWLDSYAHIVTETTVSKNLFVSEKTWKPLVAGQLFFIMGNPGSVEHLRTQGFDCYNDLLDHSYDVIPDPVERIICLQQSVKKLLSKDIHSIFKNTTERRLKNAELFFSDRCYTEYTDHLKNLLCHINTQN